MGPCNFERACRDAFEQCTYPLFATVDQNSGQVLKYWLHQAYLGCSTEGLQSLSQLEQKHWYVLSTLSEYDVHTNYLGKGKNFNNMPPFGRNLLLRFYRIFFPFSFFFALQIL